MHYPLSSTHAGAQGTQMLSKRSIQVERQSSFANVLYLHPWPACSILPDSFQLHSDDADVLHTMKAPHRETKN